MWVSFNDENKEDEMEEVRETKVRKLEFDKDDLFGCSIDNAIRFLQDVKRQYAGKKELCIEEYWIGYEENYFVVEYEEEETETEYAKRIYAEYKKREEDLKIIEKEKAIAERKRVIKLLQAEIDGLL